MTNLVLTRKAGQAVRLIIDGRATYCDILDVTGGTCQFRLTDVKENGVQTENLRVQRVRFRDSLQIAEGISVQVVDLAKGHAKLNFTAPREVQILRTELIKEKEE